MAAVLEGLKVVEFTLMGQPFMAISAGPLDPFNHAVSFIVECDTQPEIDRLWTKLSEGGQTEQCGWLKDRYGLSWQIVPTVMNEMLKNGDPKRLARVTEAFLEMKKFGNRWRVTSWSPHTQNSLPANPAGS